MSAQPTTQRSQEPRRLSYRDAAQQLTAPGQLFEMEGVAIRGVVTRTWKLAPPTAMDILALSLGHGDKAFLVYEDEQLTFADHYRHAITLAHRLRDDFGVSPGDRVVIAMRNLPEWVVTFWGTMLAGAVVVPLNAWWNADELVYGIDDSGSVVAVTDVQRADLLLPSIGSIPSLRGLVVTDEDRGRGPAGVWSPRNAAPVPVRLYQEWVGVVEQDVAPPEVTVAPDDDATIFYTSGTTGRAKGAVGTHRNMSTNLMSLYFLNTVSGLRAHASSAGQAETTSAEDAGSEPEPGQPEQNAYLLSVPLFHVTGCLSIMVPNVAAGGKIVMMHHFDPERALELIERERISVFGGVPSMVMAVLDSPDFPRRDTSSIRSVSYGGAPAPPELVRRIKQHFPGGQPNNGYGLTETSSVTTMNSGDDYVRKPDSVGPPVPVCDVVVVPEEYPEKEPAPSLPRGPQVTGELWIKGPNVVRGYWGRPEETDHVITQGWLHTGDVARIDDEGFVYVVDRAKDIIIRGGENIYSVEVEAALYEHTAVAECAVIGIPHTVLGEEVGAVVVLRPNTKVEADELVWHLQDRLARFMVPNHFWFRRESLPRNPAGKVLKRALRTEVLGES